MTQLPLPPPNTIKEYFTPIRLGLSSGLCAGGISVAELVVLLHRYGARMDREEILEIFQAGLRIRVRMTRIRQLKKIRVRKKSGSGQS